MRTTKNWPAYLLLSMLAFAPFILFAQQRTITGKVTETKTGNPIPGATVSAGSSSVMTDDTGEFSLSIQGSAPATLIISSVGFAEKQVSVATSETTINISLDADTKQLDQVIVTGVAAGTSRKKLPFAAEKISGDAIHRVPALNAAAALQGKVPGLKVFTNSGRPGEEPVIQMRGATAILGVSNPLIIVDGVFTDGGFNEINVEDIESYEVLRGAAASSLYGSRAANGVISITTKRNGP